MINENARYLRAWKRIIVILLITVLIFVLLPLTPAHAGTITVTTTADEQNNNGQCSLREAIANADANNQSGSTDCVAGTGDDTINFSVSGTFALSSEMTISDVAHLTIDGSTGGITLSGENATRVFSVNGGAHLTLKNLTIANGAADNGGGITNGGTLTISSCNLSGNTSSGSFAASGGGAIFNTGTLTVLDSTFDGNAAVVGGGGIRSFRTLTITDSTFSGNSASDGSGILNAGVGSSVNNSTFSENTAIGTGGGIANLAGTLATTNSTFSGNSAPTAGGGIYNTGTLTATNSTISGNSSSGGAGIQNGAGTTTLRNSIVANSTDGSECVGTITNGGNNLDSGTSCDWGTSNGSLSNTDPQLGPLADNDGPTQTFALLTGSPAIDAVTYNSPNRCPATDQRGYFRPVDGDSNSSAICDIGAFEFGSHPGFSTYLPLVLKGSSAIIEIRE